MKKRVITALVGIPLVLSAIFCAKPWPAASLLAFVAALALIELNSIFEVKGSGFVRGAGAVLTSVATIAMAINPAFWGVSGLAFSIGVIFAFLLTKNRSSLSFTLSTFWVLIPLAALYRLWDMSQSGQPEWWNWQSLALLVLFPLWAGDSAGIFVGRCCGKHLLAPEISPKKTWEGAIANVGGCLLLAFIVGWLLNLSITVALACGAVCAVFGQIGDLFESYLKRSAGVKDSGSILPGHGGILDRIDSILMAAPVVVMVLGFWR